MRTRTNRIALKYDPRDEGFEAGETGNARSSCPYAKGTAEYDEWTSGWDAGHELHED